MINPNCSSPEGAAELAGRSAAPSGLERLGFPVPRVALASLTYPGLFSLSPLGTFKEFSN